MYKTSVFLVAAFVVCTAGCDNRDAESLARVARCAAAKGETLAADTGGWRVLQANLDELTLDARVSARLRWDKSLEGTQVAVSILNGVLELRGTVQNDDQRKRAVELAESTVGVAKVIDSLDVTR